MTELSFIGLIYPASISAACVAVARDGRGQCAEQSRAFLALAFGGLQSTRTAQTLNGDEGVQTADRWTFSVRGNPSNPSNLFIHTQP